jgi:hypothetical protein
MEIVIKRHGKESAESFCWTVTDDYGAVLEHGSEFCAEAARRAAEMAAAWIQNKTTNDYYGG